MTIQFTLGEITLTLRVATMVYYPHSVLTSVILPLENFFLTSSSEILSKHLLYISTAITILNLYKLNLPGNLGTIYLANSYVPNTVPGT